MTAGPLPFAAAIGTPCCPNPDDNTTDHQADVLIGGLVLAAGVVVLVAFCWLKWIARRR